MTFNKKPKTTTVYAPGSIIKAENGEEYFYLGKMNKWACFMADSKSELDRKLKYNQTYVSGHLYVPLNRIATNGNTQLTANDILVGIMKSYRSSSKIISMLVATKRRAISVSAGSCGLVNKSGETTYCIVPNTIDKHETFIGISYEAE